MSISESLESDRNCRHSDLMPPFWRQVLKNAKCWRWLDDVFIPGVFAGRWYNGQQENQTVYIANSRSIYRLRAVLRIPLDVRVISFTTCVSDILNPSGTG